MEKGTLFIILFLIIVLTAGLYSYFIYIHTLNYDFEKAGDCISEWK